MSEPTKEDFDKLWNINPTFTDPNHGYESTLSMLRQRLKLPQITPDGQLVTFELIFKRYKTYRQVKSILNEGTDPKFLKKENAIQPIFKYIFDEMYYSVEKIPHTQRHFYFWGDMTQEDVRQKYEIFERVCQKS